MTLFDLLCICYIYHIRSQFLSTFSYFFFFNFIQKYTISLKDCNAKNNQSRIFYLIFGRLVDVALHVDGDGRGALVQESELGSVIEDSGHTHALLFTTYHFVIKLDHIQILSISYHSHKQISE